MSFRRSGAGIKLSFQRSEDGADADENASLKLLNLLKPLKNTKKKDFQNDPKKYLGPQYNKKQKKWWGGVEIVQRRQKLDFDDTTAEPSAIGIATLAGFQSNIEQSYKRYNTKETFEIVCVHGYDHTKKSYIMSVFWQEYQLLDPTKITWAKESGNVKGYSAVDETLHIIAERIKGNSSREGTCFKEYKDLTKYTNSISIKLPIPEQWEFDQARILHEITNLTGNTNDSPILDSE